jgi:hypothetical protein
MDPATIAGIVLGIVFGVPCLLGWLGWVFKEPGRSMTGRGPNAR